MNRLRKICLAIAAPLFCVSGIFAQEKNPADTTAVTTPAAPQDAASDDTEETLPTILLVVLGFEYLCAVSLFFKYSLSQSIG